MLRTSPYFGIATFCLWIGLATASDVTASDVTVGEWTVDDLVLAETAGEQTVSRDGQLIAWTVARVETLDGVEKPVEDIWLLRLEDGKDAQPRRWTRGALTVQSLEFSPDGRYLAFLSSRPFPGDRPSEHEEAGPQLWAIPVDGGEAFPVTDLDRAVEGYGWAGAERLVLMAAESKSAWQKERDAVEDTTKIVDDALRTPPVRLFMTDLEGQVERLTQNTDWIDQLAVSPDGKKALVTAQQSLSYQFDSKVPPKIFVVDLETGERREVLADAGLVPEFPAWSSDGSGIYIYEAHTNHPRYRMATIYRLHFYDLESKQTTELGSGWTRGVDGGFAVTQGGVIALLADGVRYRPAFLPKDGGARTDLEGTHARNLDTIAAAAEASTLFYCTSSATSPTQCFQASREGSQIVGETQVTALNPGYAGKPTGRMEVIRWRGARGDEVEGLLHYPLDWREGERHPLVLDIHGGPASADRDRWDQRWPGPNILWRQRGAFVLQVNYHGSSNYGLEWVESIEGHYYEYPIADIEAGVDSLIERGLVDPDRLGSSGWSNGGILTAELITRTGRYKAAVVGAADVEWVSDWANVDFGASFNNYYFQATPWEDPQGYLELSPFFRLDKVTTPTIIHTGTEDRAVPPHQSWSLFRVLQYLGEAPVRLALYPGEGHGLTKIAHQRRKVEEDLAWFDHYLFKTRPVLFEDRAIPEDSRLSVLLARAQASRDESGRFGVVQKRILVPEMVEADGGLKVARFEVTRAQFAAFSGEKIPPLKANLPAAGIRAEQARAYARWLSDKTGQRFRLPSQAEAEKLGGGDGGNTLDHWVGYAPNPEDARSILARLGAKTEGAPLLLPVGSLKPSKAGVFDLDGNVAEWVETSDGEAQIHGASADRPASAASRQPASAAYVGFRVVMD